MMEKIGYPNYDVYMNNSPARDTKKWLEAVKEIYYKEKNGMDRVQSIRQVTSGWNPVETFDFINWLKFYEEGAHLKYKKAQLWYENGAPGYFLHMKPDPIVPVEHVSGKDIDDAKDHSNSSMSNSEKKNIIERQRSKIIGRLDSAEKLLRSEDGQMFAGKELEVLMEAIYSLKKKVQLVNKLSTSTRLYEDMIVREANVLGKNGFYKAADMLYSVAQMPKPPSPAPPIASTGDPGGLPSMGPGMPQNPPENAPNQSPNIKKVPKGIKEFLNRTETANITEDDELEVSDNSEAEDSLEVFDSDNEDLVVEAQAIDEPMTSNTSPAPETKVAPPKQAPKPISNSPAEESLEVSEDDLPEPGKSSPEASSSNFESQLDSIMANTTISDIIVELEIISKIYSTKELVRRLSRVDMMMDHHGIASFFPSLSEAQNKAIESSNYGSTRIDDILSKLKGSTGDKEVDITGENGPPPSPKLDGLRSKLQNDQDKEKARKQMRKDQEAAELDSKNKETPNVEIEEDLAPPVAPPAAAPAPSPKPNLT
jgi:hypothetical protein